MNIKIEQANIKDLNKQAPMLMRALHNTFHYDFNQPYGFYHIDGRFTIKQLEPYMLDKAETVILIRVKPNEHIYDIWQSDRLNLVRYNPHENGGYQIECCHARGAGWSDSFDYFIRKSDFDTMRKSDKTDAWVLSQVYTDMRIPNKKASEINAYDRYKVIDHYGNPIMDTTRDVAMCNFVPYCGTGERVDKTYFGWDVRELSLSDYMDKSGYCVYLTRHELGRKLKEIKDKRAKDEYLATDNSDKVATLARLIDQYKAKIAEDLMKADTTDAIYEVSKHLDYFSGLRGIMEDFDTFKEKTENKDFGSINASNALYDRINKRIYDYL